MKFIKAILVVAFFFLTTFTTYANNINISNVVSGTNATGVYLTFDLSWENSWRNATNYDAAWVFFKFKDLDGAWHHLNLSGNNNVISAGFAINAADSTGAMIYRSTTGYGNVSITGVQVGVVNLPGSFDIRSFAIEMVQIPQNVAYYLGDGNGSTFSYFSGNTPSVPYFLNTVASGITFGTAVGNLNDNALTTPLATGFPIGYATTVGNNYMMKHELSQGAYKDFLNCLTYTQQISRTVVAPNSTAGTYALAAFLRNSITITTPGVASTTPAVYGCFAEWLACGSVTGMDLLAFLDWAALRPMTDFEYEKACRGPLTPKKNEYAWGDTAISRVSYSINNAGTATEGVTYTGSVLNGNATHGGYYSPSGGARVGMHATAYATRISAGATYYGVLDMTGNVNEYMVASGGLAGRSFTGINGNGELNANGEADEDYWPGINGNATVTTPNTVYGGVTGVTAYAGLTQKGGSYSGAQIVSYRIGSGSGSTVRSPTNGGRGVKSW